MTIDLRGCRCHCVVPQTTPSGLSPLHDSQSARGFPTSVRSGRQKQRGCRVVKASSSRDEYGLGAGGPNMVDADMILLRKRVYELQLQENKYESPREWMQWEKKWHGKYRSSVYQAMECLQFNLINTRPAASMALLSLVSLSVPASVVVVAPIGAFCADRRFPSCGKVDLSPDGSPGLKLSQPVSIRIWIPPAGSHAVALRLGVMRSPCVWELCSRETAIAASFGEAMQPLLQTFGGIRQVAMRSPCVWELCSPQAAIAALFGEVIQPLLQTFGGIRNKNAHPFRPADIDGEERKKGTENGLSVGEPLLVVDIPDLDRSGSEELERWATSAEVRVRCSAIRKA